ncbi:peptidoglycan glycosyltransferase [Desulfacinum hydrothermale DSM 13146]|uniref:Peptidoglycan glycosyltransferase n=1 Tax=Desulfacinum hydrothermale DSM 13146 TaxID=1121390 RepID=A0A1W1XVP0_9BACT|nr:penicillin-binding protein 2 [Desulfacinum hydrothermale]SMC28003.1 peptidoglycan glycosyltransferase [Desulfacinum hydrothermale DSM 13146]
MFQTRSSDRNRPTTRRLVRPDAKGLQLIQWEASERRLFERQCRIILAVFLAVLAGYVLRLWYLQILSGAHFRELSENNRIRFMAVRAPRGLIFDRNGTPLVENRPAYHLMLVREDIKAPHEVGQILEELARICAIPEQELRQRLEANKTKRAFEPIRLLEDMDRDTLARLEARRMRLPGVYIEVEPKRRYRWNGTAAHLIGYLGEISEKELQSRDFRDYQAGEYIGKGGVEKTFEPFLHGEAGWRQVEVDALGRHIRSLDEKLPIPGRNVWLSIDLDVQRTAEECLEQRVGAIVAVSPKTGEVLAMASSPSYDQEKFVRGMTVDEWNGLINDPFHPLLNRAIASSYPPGSTYKPFVALAALEEGIVQPDTDVFCPGFMQLGRRRFRCWRDWGHGHVNLHRGIVESCDVYFYQTGLKLGVDAIARYARMFGFGQKTGIDLPGERSGLVPTRQWKKRTKGVSWQKGETLTIAIGQGFDLVTPLQLAMAYAALANGGTLLKPRIVDRIEAGFPADGLRAPSGSVRRQLPIDKKNLELVRQALQGVVEEPRGTAHRIRVPGVRMAGKTGTAQVVHMPEGMSRKLWEKMSKDLHKDHAWFVGYAPAEDPEIVVAVLVEHGGHGSSGAAPLAQKVILSYLEKMGRVPTEGASGSGPNAAGE